MTCVVDDHGRDVAAGAVVVARPSNVVGPGLLSRLALALAVPAWLA